MDYFPLIDGDNSIIRKLNGLKDYRETTNNNYISSLNKFTMFSFREIIKSCHGGMKLFDNKKYYKHLQKEIKNLDNF